MSMEPPASPPPPPPPPSGQPYGYTAPGSFRVGDAINYGWTAYWRNAGPMILLVLVIWVINLVFSLVGLASDDTAFQILIRLIGWIVGLLVALGLIRASLAVTRGEMPTVDMLFRSEGFGPYIIATILFGIGVFVGLILLVIPGIIFAIVFHFYGYVIAESGDAVTATDALRRSAEITRGHRWQLLGLGLLLVLINLVGLLACGIGLLFTYGITAITLAYAYRVLSGQPVAPVS